MKHQATRFLLVTAPYHKNNLADHKIYVVEPLQFEVLAALIDRTQFEIDILDLRLDRKPRAFTDRLGSFQPEIIGFTSWTMHVDCVRRLAREAKEMLPSAVNIVGGEHTRISPEDFAIPEIDFIVMGEAYNTVPELLSRIRAGERQMPGLPGVAYRNGDEFVSNGEVALSPHFDLNALPFPDRTVAERYLKRYYHLWWKPIAAVRTAMGCPSRCSFCNLWKVNNGKYLRWDPEYVVDYLGTISEPYVMIVDDHFFGDARRAMAIGHAIERAGIKKQYCLYSRADAIARDPELVEIWSRIGLKRVRMGLESYSDNALESMNKGASIEQSDIAICTLKKHRVLIEGLFMVGLDYAEDDFAGLEKYIRSHKIEVPNITLYTPMPGTPDYYDKRDQMIDSTSWYFDFQHITMPTTMSTKAFCERYAKLMMRVQRPPWEQIQRIGLRSFIERMPNFWRYFWSLKTSYRHYQHSPPSDPDLLPWREEAGENFVQISNRRSHLDNLN